ncbi:MAG: serine hydroxymethyltransferase [Gemmatimonadetes bacterium]|nr:serine hydroxymethyltransferase [Gemmatimonadota bacterium]
MTLQESDPAVWEAITAEAVRQETGLELIASENFVSRAVLEATGCVLTNKYAEGYPGRRYYGGCEEADKVEELAASRALELYGAEHANVQAHSGSQANMAAYRALASPAAKLMGMNLAHGGHLTHGHPVNFSGRQYQVVQYGVHRETQQLDYSEVAGIALQEKPDIIVAGASAYPRTLDFAKFAEIAADCGARLVVDMAHIAGLVAAGAHPSPVPHADVVTTTTHKTLRGPRGGLILCTAEHAREIDQAVFPGLQGGPLMHVIAAKAVALGEALTDEFRGYAWRVVENARALAGALADIGLNIVSGGTDTHLVLVDLGEDGLTGAEAEKRLGAAGITVNKNTVPFDTRSPFVTSGIRLGTAALSSRGMGETEMRRIAGMMALSLDAGVDDPVQQRVQREVADLCSAFPLYGPRWDGSVEVSLTRPQRLV